MRKSGNVNRLSELKVLPYLMYNLYDLFTKLPYRIKGKFSEVKEKSGRMSQKSTYPAKVCAPKSSNLFNSSNITVTETISEILVKGAVQILT